ncbi:MAG TPA: PAS domain S-box protein [Methanosarcina sp.]|nr:PAS domain S-box protein [Methanosarcina sp.]
MKVKIGQSPSTNSNTVFDIEKDDTVLELANIIDSKAIQSLMNDFYRLAHIPMGLLDLKGNVLVNVGWQDICTKFHRVNPESCKHCIESDINLSTGIAPGSYKLYKCKNNMWDVVTPVMVEGQHIGNIFSGQFFFEDEPLDYELFRSQARKYGFNEEEYIAALEKVPRLSREAIDTSMAFFMTFANMISQLSYSNIKLSQSLAERDAVVEALRESEKRERARSSELTAVLDTVPVAVYTAHDPQALRITGNRLSYEWLKIPLGTNLSKTAHEGKESEFFKLFKNGMEIPPEKMPSRLSAKGIEINNCELDIESADGEVRHLLGNARPLRDEQGNLRGSVSAFIDITERRRVEEELQKALETLRYSEDQFRGLFHNVKSGVTLIDEAGRFAVVNPSFMQMFGLDDELDILNVNSQDWSRWKVYGEDGKPLHVDDHPVRKVVITGKPVKSQLVAVRNPGAEELTWMLISAEPVMKEDGHIYRVICTYHDITERKRAEEALKKSYDTLEEKVKERTVELQEAYNSLKESEKRLADSQKIAHIGNWDWKIATGEEYWSDELYNIFGLDSQFELNHNTFLNCIHPDDLDYVSNAINEALNGKSYHIEYKIILPDGEERIIYSEGGAIFDEKNTPVRMRGIVQDITERKKAEEALTNIEVSRKKEIHHRIKNNLQVISSLLDLQAEQFRNREDIKDSEVLEAFGESQDRVISMALIHEELYRGGGFETLNFSPYIQELTKTLFETYSLGDTKIALRMDLEENLFFDMDTAVPLGMIVNELVSNSLKHAFTGRDKGEIRIELCRQEPAEFKEKECESTNFTLKISDNGVGIPEFDIENLDSLGMQLVTSLVDQLDGELELKRTNGTEFIIKFMVTDKDNQNSHVVG